MNLRELARQRPTDGGPEQSALPLSTARATWPGLRALIVGMLAPFALVVWVYARFFGGGAAGVGLTRATLRRDLALGTAIGIPMAGAAALIKRWAAPSYRRHTIGDHALQTTFFMAINAPIEELFWRGMIQKLVIQGAERVLGPGTRATAAGWALTTLGFGAFHTIGGNWPWRAVIGATAGGGVFGLVYLLQPQPRSILPSILVHGFSGSGLFSWGDAFAQWSARRAPTRRAG